ncbi:MAG TPA: UbiX family flavin prenyltransferase [Thermoplasmatales archaeon]|nr:UbiX family flavin prenyltransferase [Thermoplasmatales archaeon]
MSRILVSIGGASGVVYGIRLLEELKKLGVETHLVLSDTAREIIMHETSRLPEDVESLAHYSYRNNDLFAPPSSGSYPLDAMVVIPCSLKTLSAIANGYCDTLTSRAAVCCLKERKKLILVIRETPLDLSTIDNMRRVYLNGAVVLPASPGFYHKPKSIDDLVSFIVGKTLDQLGFSHSLYKAWGT